MKLTKEIKDAKDKYGHPIDFTFCLKCNSFIHFTNREIDFDITCQYCRSDKHLLLAHTSRI